MKTVRFLILSLIIAACLCFSLNVQAQGDDKLPRPFLEVVSVDPETGEVTIKWDVVIQPGSPDVDRFGLYFFDNSYSSGGEHRFAIVPVTAREYKFKHENLPAMATMMPDPKKFPVTFTVASIPVTATNAGDRSLLALPYHRNIQVNSKFDSCRSEIRLNWHPYNDKNIGWFEHSGSKKPLDSYHVMQSVNGGPYEEIIQLTPQDTFYVVPRVEDNKIYKFYIAAKRSDGEMATSYHTKRETKMPRPPDFITALGTEYNSDGLAEVSFKLDPLAETYSYEFFGASQHEYNFVSLGYFDKIRGDTILTDIQKRERTFYYKLEAWHICKNKYTAASNIATALWLTVKQEGAFNILSWEPYIDWDGPAQYDVYRKNGDNPEEVITTVTDPATTDYSDNMAGVYIEGDICYWVIATPIASHLQQAVSNTVCFKPESDIFIPQAFTPNIGGMDYGIDSEFKPFFSYPPQDYLFVAYDRNGAIVFETRDVNAGWNGYLLNGKPASEGVYTYRMRFRTEMGRLVEKKGTFALIYRKMP